MRDSKDGIAVFIGLIMLAIFALAVLTLGACRAPAGGTTPRATAVKRFVICLVTPPPPEVVVDIATSGDKGQIASAVMRYAREQIRKCVHEATAEPAQLDAGGADGQ